MTSPAPTPELEAELAVQAVVSDVQALDQHYDRLEPQINHLIYAREKINNMIEYVRQQESA